MSEPVPNEAAADSLKRLGRYQIVRTIGRGAMGLVYEGFDPNVGRKVAIKTILVQALPPEMVAEFENRFRTEARSAGRLQHPNIVSVYDADRDLDVAYLVMEYVKGRDLKQLIDEGATFTLGDIRSIMRQLLAALDCAHQQHIIHRDIKPANMLIQADGALKLTDFGVARIADSGEATRTGGGLVGTLKYMSPEQVKGLPIDTRADVFSAGVVLYQLLTGRQPFRGENDFALIRQIANEEPPSPSSLNSLLNPEVDAVVAKALAKEPDDRYPSAREFASDLRRVLQKAEGVAPTADPDAESGATPETFSDTRTPASPQFVSRLAAAAAADATAAQIQADGSVSSVTAFNSLNDEATLVVASAGAAESAQTVSSPKPDQAAPSGVVAVAPAGGKRWGLAAAVAVVIAGVGWALLGGQKTPPSGPLAPSATTVTGPDQAASGPGLAVGATPTASLPVADSLTRMPTGGRTTTVQLSKRTATAVASPGKVASGPAVAPEQERERPATPAQPNVAAPTKSSPSPSTAGSPSAACADRSFFTRSACVFQQCERVAEFRNHPECVAQREEFRQRDERIR